MAHLAQKRVGTTIPYLTLRGSTYQYRRVLPLNLAKLAKVKEVNRSLRTSDKLTAQQRALKLSVAIQKAFAMLNAAMRKIDLDKDLPLIASRMLEAALVAAETEWLSTPPTISTLPRLQENANEVDYLAYVNYDSNLKDYGPSKEVFTDVANALRRQGIQTEGLDKYPLLR